VSGLAPDRAVRRLLMALNFQAFVDDSWTTRGEFVLGGHVAPAEAWANFAKEWEVLLPTATRAKNGKWHFKMSEMAASPERMARVPPFYAAIEKFVTLSVSCRINLEEFERAIARVKSRASTFDWHVIFDRWENPFFFNFRCLIDALHHRRVEALWPVIPLTEKIDFYFDERSEKKFIIEAWDEYVQNSPEDVQEFYGTTPRFENDQIFLPLQGADLWAWWVREWAEEDAIEVPDKMAEFDFGGWRGKKRPFLAIALSENDIVDHLEGLAVNSRFPPD
jgi:hypothetical protein